MAKLVDKIQMEKSPIKPLQVSIVSWQQLTDYWEKWGLNSMTNSFFIPYNIKRKLQFLLDWTLTHLGFKDITGSDDHN